MQFGHDSGPEFGTYIGKEQEIRVFRIKIASQLSKVGMFIAALDLNQHCTSR